MWMAGLKDQLQSSVDVLVVPVVQNLGVAPVHRVVVSPGMLYQCHVGTVT